MVWSPIGRAKRTYASYRINEIKKYLIALDRNIRDMQTNSECNKIFVFTDESYVNVNHSCKNSYLPQDKNKDPKISKKSGKGRRLIILHAIAEHGPLVDLHEGRPVDDLRWRGDTPHPEAREDGKQTCETLWMANSNTGDYHNNMNSEMFMLWVKERLVPVFEKKHPGKKMVLVADNAPYHHKRIIGALGNVPKKRLVDMMVSHGVEYVDLPYVTDQRY